MDGPDVLPPPPPVPPPVPVQLPGDEDDQQSSLHEDNNMFPIVLSPSTVTVASGDVVCDDDEAILSSPYIVPSDESKGFLKVRLNQYQVILMKKGRTGSEMFRSWRTRRFILSQQTFYYYQETVLKGSINVYKSTSYAITASEFPEVKSKKYPFLMKTVEGEGILFSADNEPTRQKTIYLLNFAARDMNWSYNPNEIYTYQSPMISDSHLPEEKEKGLSSSSDTFQGISPMRLRSPPPVPTATVSHHRTVSTASSTSAPDRNPFNTTNSSPIPSRPPPPIAHNPLNATRSLSTQGARRPSTLSPTLSTSPLFNNPSENPRYLSPLRVPPVPVSSPSPLLMEAYKEKFAPSPVPESSPPPVPPPIPTGASDTLQSTEAALPDIAPPPPPMARTTSVSPIPRRVITEASSPLKW